MGQVLCSSKRSGDKTTIKSECEICRKEIPSGAKTSSNQHEVIIMRNVLKTLLIPQELLNCDPSLVKESLQSKQMCPECSSCLADISVNVLFLEKFLEGT